MACSAILCRIAPYFEIGRPNCSLSLAYFIDKLISFVKKNGPKEFKYGYKLEIDNEVTPETWKKKIF